LQELPLSDGAARSQEEAEKNMKNVCRMKKTLFWLGLFMGLAVSANSQEKSLGEDCRVNLPVSRILPTPGGQADPAVQSKGGSMDDHSDGAAYEETVKSYLQAVGQDYATAELLLGFLAGESYDLYFFDREATRRCRHAAEQGDATAQVKLGSLYADGKSGVGQDYKEAVKWFRRAAETGQPDGQFLLGEMYYQGRGVPQDYVQAYKWWSLAAAMSSGSKREQAIINRYLAEEKMTLAQILEAQRLTRKLVRSPPSP
jgi:hypothetical protein